MKGIVRWMNQAVGTRERSRGQLLIEVLIALALLGIISTVFIGAMYTALHSARIADEQSIALTLCKSEIEYVKQQEYSTTDWEYSVTYSGNEATLSADEGAEPSWWPENPDDLVLPSSGDFGGYMVTVTGGEIESGLRLITAIAVHQGTQVLTLENYKLSR